VWITKSSTVDDKGNIGFPTSLEEVRRFGHGARKIFLNPPPSELHKSFSQIVQLGREDQPPRPWKKRADEARAGARQGRYVEEGDVRAKRQVGMGAQGYGTDGSNSEDEPRTGGYRQQDPWHGRRQDDYRGPPKRTHDHTAGGVEDSRKDLQPDEGTRVTHLRPVELRERLNVGRDKKVLDRRDEDPRKLKCFRCQGSVHYQKDCTNAPICYKCKEEGHMVAECADFHAKASDLKMFGFVIPDQGFYSIKIPDAGSTQRASCIVQVLQGEANEKKIKEELKNLISNQWDWQVKQIQDKEYVVVFPDKSSLETFSKISEILLGVHGIKVKILKTNFNPEASEMLQQTWVKIYGLPAIACKEDIVRKVATLAGEPLVVDELSLIKIGHVRVKMNVRDPFKLRGFVRIFLTWWDTTSDSYLRSIRTMLLYLHHPHIGRIMMKTMKIMWMRILRRREILVLEEHRKRGNN
jgi:hypothetical protein